MDIVEPVETNLVRISPNWMRSQPSGIEELMRSIAISGLLQPIILRPDDSGFEIISGHRRFLACKNLHWIVIPSIIKEVTQKVAFEMSLVENVQRESLSIVEEARAYRKYTDEYGWGSIKELSARIGKSEAYVSHVISILKLPPKIHEKLEANQISRSIAQELLWVRDEELRMKLADLSSTSGLKVKDIRKAAKMPATYLVEGEEEHCSPEADNPFSTNWVKDRPSGRQIVLEKVALTLRIALIRIDSLVEKTEDQDLREFLIKKRYALHNLLDEIISHRKLSLIV